MPRRRFSLVEQLFSCAALLLLLGGPLIAFTDGATAVGVVVWIVGLAACFGVLVACWRLDP